jgi:DNA polymerase-3 subunit beta
MKVIVQTAALQEALALASSIVAIRTPKPVLQCVKLVAKGKTLTLLATDLEAACRYTVAQVEVQDEGEALVPVGKFADIVRETSDETLTIAVEKESCSITGSGTRFKLLGFDPAEYPAVTDFEDAGDFQAPSDVLSSLIEKTLFAAAKAHSHYAISGVLWEASGKKLQLVATDGHRLAVAKTALAKPAARDVTAIVPAKLMALLQRAVGTAQEALSVKVTENQILVRTAKAVLISSLVQGNFPKYSDVIPRESGKKATVNAQDFAHRIRQAALLTNEESKGVRLEFKTDLVTLTSRAPETGEAEVTMPAKYGGDVIQIAFNPTFLIDALKVIQAEDVTVEMNASNKPAVLKGGADFTYVVMPVDL